MVIEMAIAVVSFIIGFVAGSQATIKKLKKEGLKSEVGP